MSTMYGDTGVYVIRNTVNGKFYVGSAAVSLSSRWSEHKYGLRKNRHANPHLQAAWNKYGENSFEFLILKFCEPEYCSGEEQYYLDTLRPYDREVGYNVCKLSTSRLGVPIAEETKRKLSEINKGKKLSEETRAKISAAGKGRVMSLEHIQKVAEWHRGRKRSRTTCQKMSTNRRRKRIEKQMQVWLDWKKRAEVKDV